MFSNLAPVGFWLGFAQERTHTGVMISAEYFPTALPGDGKIYTSSMYKTQLCVHHRRAVAEVAGGRYVQDVVK